MDGNDSLFTSLQRPKRQQRRHGVNFNDLHEDGNYDVPLVQAVIFVAAGSKITLPNIDTRILANCHHCIGISSHANSAVPESIRVSVVVCWFFYNNQRYFGNQSFVSVFHVA